MKKLIQINKEIKMVWFVLVIILASGIIFWKNANQTIEMPIYKVNKKEGAIEIREYASLLLAQTKVEGERQEAIQKGFRRIATYIFGENTSSEKIEMTSPVLQEGMDTSWTISFVMPAKYSKDTLPKPKDDLIDIKEKKTFYVAAIRFSGKPSMDSLEVQTTLLSHFLEKENHIRLSSPIYAFYNPPWTLPFLRRNEVWIEIKE